MERPQSIKDQFPGEEFWTEQQYIARVKELEAEVERLRAFARWCIDTRDAEGIPARYETISERAVAALGERPEP